MYNKGDEAMKIFFKRVVVVLLIVTMFFGGIPNVKALAITQSTVSSQLNSLIGQYANHTATSAQMYMGSQCKGFANWIFLKIFGVYIGAYPENANYKLSNANAQLVGMITPGSLNESTAKTLLQKASPGDYIQVQRSIAKSGGKCGPHSMIVVGVSTDGVQVFDCNSDGRNTIKTYLYTWPKFNYDNRAMTLYHAYNYQGGSSSNKPNYSNFWLSRNNTSYTEYGLNDKIEVNVEASNYDHLTMGIDKDGVGRVVTKEINSHYEFSAKELGAGSYSIYVTASNSQGYVDTNTLWFKIQTKPSYTNFWLSKKNTSYIEYSLGDNIEVNVEAQNYDHLTVGIDKDGVGRVVTKEITSHYVFSSRDLGIGNYSIYVTVANSQGYVDTNTLWFAIKTPRCDSFSLSKSSYEINENISINVKASYYNKLIVGIDKDGVGRVVTKDIPTNYTFQAKSLGVGDYTVYVSVYDKNENYTDSKKLKFRIYQKESAHSYGTWITTKKATCTSNGTEQRKCNLCGKTETRTIKATGHKYTNKTIAPTITEKGYTLHTCSTCGYSYKDNYTNVKKQLQSITVSTKPSKTTYSVNDAIDTSGMKIVATYTDGSKTEVSGWKINGSTIKAGKYNVKVTYSEGGITKESSYEIQVNEKSVPKETLYVTYKTNGGAMSQTKQSGTKGSTIQLLNERPAKSVNVTFQPNGGDQNPSPVSLPQTFKYWLYNSSTTMSTSYYPGSSLSLTQNCTLYAQYNDAKLTTLPVISREGYVFDGWYTPNNILAYAGMSVTNDMILTAHWTKQIQKTDDNKNQVVDDKKYELDYDADDEIDDDTLTVGDELETDQAIYTITKTEGGYCVEYSELFDDDLKSTYIPDTVAIDGIVYRVTSIGEKAFYKNTSLKNIVIGSNVEKIDTKAFYGCTSLNSIVINSTKLASGKIGANAFKKINKNVRVYVLASKYKAYKKMLKKAGIGSKAKIYKMRTR